MIRANILVYFLVIVLACFFMGCGEEDDSADTDKLDDEVTSGENGDSDDGSKPEDTKGPELIPVGDSSPLEGRDASEYEILMDFEHMMDSFGPDVFEDELGDEERKFINAVKDVVGFDDLEQTTLQAKKDGDTVSIRSVIEYDGNNEDSLCALLTKWRPANADTIKSIQGDDLWGMIAFGNFQGYVDTLLEWGIETDAADTIIDSIPEDEVDVSGVKGTAGLVKMMAKGFWLEAQEEYFPYFGDEVIFAVFENDNFLGWEGYWMADSVEEIMPVRLLLAVELRKQGFTDLILNAMEENAEFLEGFADGMTYDTELARDFWDIKTKEMDNYEIHYLDIDADGMDIRIGWTEYDNTFIISDLDTLENLNNYFNPSRPETGYPGRYCQYVYVNVDKPLDTIPGSLSELIREGIESQRQSVEWMNENDPDSPITRQMNDRFEEEIKFMEDILDIVEDTKGFGSIEIVSLPIGRGFETTVTCSEDVAGIWLKLYDLIEKEIEFGY